MTELRFKNQEDAERAIDALLAIIPPLVLNASRSAYQAWLDGRTPVVTEDTVRAELLRIIGGSA